MHAESSHCFKQTVDMNQKPLMSFCMNRMETCMHNTCMELYGKTNKTKRKMNQLKRSACELIEGKFVNPRVLLGLFIQNRLRDCLRLLGILVRHVQETFFRHLKFVNLFLKFSAQLYKRIE